MAPNNKKGGRANNKKKGKGRAGLGQSSGSSNASTASTSNPSATASSRRQDSLTALRTTNIPTFHRTNAETTGNTGGYYEVYKQATTRFWNWMKETLPESKLMSVNDLSKAADAILDRNIQSLEGAPPGPIVTPKHVMEELSVSIQYRQMLTATKFAETGGDKGHQYMIEVLRYCRSVLRFGRRVAKVAILETNEKEATTITGDEKDHHQDIIGGRFNALILEEDEEENENDEEPEDSEALEKRIRQRKFPVFEAPDRPDHDIDIQEVLINGDDRFQAIALLQTMDDLMGAVEHHYGLLKNLLREHDRRDGQCVQLLMECAVAANMATESVRVAENALAVNHPHLSSFYHVLALVFLTSQVAETKQMIDKTKLEQDAHMALQFAAKIVESCFHNRGDKRLPGIVKKFVGTSGLSLKDVETQARGFQMIVSLETQLAFEEPMNAQLNHQLAAVGMRPHMWLRQSGYIGGEACILNTQSIAQKVMDAVDDGKRLVAKPGFWGPEFDENTNPAKSIRGGLDEAFAANILPELMAICQHAPFSCLPERAQLLTVLDLMDHHVKNDRTSPIPVALTFGLHAILTSVMVLQGNGDLARIASFAKESYNTLFAQLDDLSDPTKLPENAPNFYMNVGLFKNLVNFAHPVKSTYDTRVAFLDPAIAERLAFWNPLIGGEYMLYGTYMCSIGVGSATVDSLGQLRFSLHLYNALKQRDPTINVPFLQNIDKVFAKTKAVWVGGRPDKGSYCKHFWLAWGMSLAEVSRKGSDAAGGSGAMSSFLQSRRNPNSDLTR
jgi:hypothetical protein